MSRYRGPRVKKLRSLDENLPGLSRKLKDRRPYKPGQHGSVGKKKQTEYGRRLQEKQKLRFNYGLSEKQLRRLMIEAKASKDASGSKLLSFLESRLDNAVFRAGFAATIPAARQLINHGHIVVNSKRVDIASKRVKVGEVISLKDKSKELVIVQESLGSMTLTRPDWLSYNDQEKTFNIVSPVSEESVPFPIDVQLVVEYYAKRL